MHKMTKNYLQLKVKSKIYFHISWKTEREGKIHVLLIIRILKSINCFICWSKVLLCTSFWIYIMKKAL